MQVTVDDADTQGLLIDADPSTPALNGGPLALNEQPGPDNAKQYTVRLETRPTAAVEVSIESGDRTVSVDGDATPRTRTLTFSTSTWDTAQTVTATAAQDDDASDEAVAIAHQASGGDYGDVSATLTATTVDDDAPALVLATTTLASGVAEGSTATYTVRLATQPAGPVTVAAAVTTTATGAVEVDVDGGPGGRAVVAALRRGELGPWRARRRCAASKTTTARTARRRYGMRRRVRTTGAWRARPPRRSTCATTTRGRYWSGASTVHVNEGSTAQYAVRLGDAAGGRSGDGVAVEFGCRGGAGVAGVDDVHGVELVFAAAGDGARPSGFGHGERHDDDRARGVGGGLQRAFAGVGVDSGARRTSGGVFASSRRRCRFGKGRERRVPCAAEHAAGVRRDGGGDDGDVRARAWTLTRRRGR